MWWKSKSYESRINGWVKIVWHQGSEVSLSVHSTEVLRIFISVCSSMQCAVCTVSSVCISFDVYEEKWWTLIRCRNHIHCPTNTYKHMLPPPLEGKDVISLNYFDKRNPENIHKLPLSFKHLNRREWFPFYIIYIVESTFVWPSSVSLSFVKTISTSSYFVQGLYRVS